MEQHAEERLARIETRLNDYEKQNGERIARLEVAIEDLKLLRPWVESHLSEMKRDMTREIEKIHTEANRKQQSRLVAAGVVIAGLGLILNNIVAIWLQG